jgi:acetyltransferase-like isoleucine patch superfamily enzyme
MSEAKPFIHKDALVESDAIGAGTRVWRNAHIMPGAVVGKNCNIGENCFIEGHVTVGNGVTIKNNVAIWDNITIGDDVFVGPAAVFTNDMRPRAHIKKTFRDLEATVIKKGATIGANATVLCGITIHDHAFVGAGSVVVRDVPAYGMVYGNPARLRGFICECTRQLAPANGRCQCACGLAYVIDGQSFMPVS